MGLLSLVPLPYRLVALAIAAAALVAFGWLKGNAHGTQKLYDFQAKLAAEEVRIAKAREIVTTRVVTRYVKAAAASSSAATAVQKEVSVYANPGLELDVPWRRLHDAAALNGLPDPAPGADAAPRAAEALETVTGNYAACHRTEDRLEALQGWVREQAAVR